jgi:tRNA A-37 threonylcarbamoyl transferase component Bud32
MATLACQYCGTTNRGDATYCNTCGALLTGGSAAHPAAGAAASRSGAARSTAAPPVNATGRLPPQSTLQNHYLILSTIGKGGMAAVYKATELTTGQTVAIKEMSQDGLSPDELHEALSSFTFEAETLRRLRHANLPRVYESFSEGGRHYLVMDFIEGETLEQRLQAAGGQPLPEAEVLGWARQLCDVLGYLHGQRPPIIFRDLKPANVMVTADDRIYLIDFGIARVFAPGRTRDTQVLGTPGFAPPEQYGKLQTDARADIYALGCTLYQLLSAYDPATTPFSLPPLSSRNPRISPAVQQAIERATKLDRETRFPTVADFGRELLTAPSSSPARTPAAPAGASATTQAPRAAARAAAVPLAAIVVVQPAQVDFGTVEAGAHGTVAVTISGQGGATVKGQITPLAPWLRVDPASFDGKSTVVRVHAEPGRRASPGKQQGMLQIICDGQQLFVPAAVQVQPAKKTSGRRATAGPAAAASTPRVVPNKYTVPAPRAGRGVSFATSFAVGIGLAAALFAQGPRLLGLPAQGPLTLPLPAAVGVLALAGLLAGAGALVGAGGAAGAARLPRLATSLLGGLAGILALLLFMSPFAWPPLTDLLVARVPLHPLALVLAAVLAGLGGAIGADPLLSQWLHAAGRFALRYARLLTGIALVLGGAWLGFALTQGLGVFAVCLTPIAVIAGALLGLAVARILPIPSPRRGRPPRMRGRRYARLWP